MTGLRVTRRAGATAGTAVLLVTAIGLAGCVSVEGTGPSMSATPEPGTSAAPTSSPTEQEEVEIYFAVAQPTRLDLVAEFHDIEHDGDLLAAALGALTTGAMAPSDPDYANLWNGVPLVGLAREGDVLRVDLGASLADVGAEAESVAIEQLVWTATSIDPSIRALAFTIDGSVVESLGGHVDARGAFERDLPESVLTPVQILVPAHGETVTSPVRATGVACVFEATFGWELLRGGTVIDEGVGMSAESCPTRAAWSLDLGARQSGEYTLVITEYSAEDGSAVAIDSKTFSVGGA